MSKSPQQAPSLEGLDGLEPRAAVARILGWWPSYSHAVQRIRTFLPEQTRLELRGLNGWVARGIPRARQTAVMQAVLQDFGVVLDFATIERLTADRIAAAADDTANDTACVKHSQMAEGATAG